MEALELVSRPGSIVLKDEAVVFSCALIGQLSGDQKLTPSLCLGGRPEHTVAVLSLRLWRVEQGGLGVCGAEPDRIQVRESLTRCFTV